MDGTGEAIGDQLTVDRMTKETPSELTAVFNPESSSNKDEDLLDGLSQEEKECVEYLLQTINNLEEDILKDDEENEHTAESLGAEDYSKTSDDLNIQPTLSSEGVLSKPCSHLLVSKMKMFKSLSVESDDVALRSRTDLYCLKPKGLQRSSNSHPSHIRKFDTIIKSGVNVQELCSRFNLHCDKPALAAAEAREDIVGATKQLEKLPAGQKSPRVEALQKLGLLHGNSGSPNINQSLVTEVCQYAKASLVEAMARFDDDTEEELKEMKTRKS